MDGHTGARAVIYLNKGSYSGYDYNGDYRKALLQAYEKHSSGAKPDIDV